MFVNFNKIAIIATLCLLAACADGSLNSRSNTITKTPTYIRMAPSAPPARIQETIPVIRTPRTHFWRLGHWLYNGSNFNWVRGNYILRPAPTAFWLPDRWERHTYGWAFIPGHWK